MWFKIARVIDSIDPVGIGNEKLQNLLEQLYNKTVTISFSYIILNSDVLSKTNSVNSIPILKE